MIIFLSLLVCIIGVIMYIISTNAKVVEIGWVMMTCGLLAFLLKVGPDAFKVLGG